MSFVVKTSLIIRKTFLFKILLLNHILFFFLLFHSNHVSEQNNGFKYLNLPFTNSKISSAFLKDLPLCFCLNASRFYTPLTLKIKASIKWSGIQNN